MLTTADQLGVICSRQKNRIPPESRKCCRSNCSDVQTSSQYILNHATRGWKQRQNAGYWIISQTGFQRPSIWTEQCFPSLLSFFLIKPCRNFTERASWRRIEESWILRGFRNVLIGKNIVHLLRALKASVENKMHICKLQGGSQDFSRGTHNFPNPSNHTLYPPNPKSFSGDLIKGEVTNLNQGFY